MSYRTGAAVTLGVAATIVLLGVGIAFAGLPDPDPDPDHEVFSPDEALSEPLPASGTVDPDPTVGDGSGVIVIDDSNANRFDRADVQPLAEALSGVGYEVRFHATGDMDEALADADGLVVIDPGSAYAGDDLAAVEEFVDGGGRLVILGEPNRISIAADLLGPALTEQESQLTEIGGAFDLHFDTRYVYDQTANDGTYQEIVVEPHEDAALPPNDGTAIDEIDRVALQVATEVRSTGGGEPMLVTSDQARTAGEDDPRRHTVAVRDGDVLGVGDSSFLAADRHNVADNEILLASITEFLVSGDRVTGVPDEVGDGLDEGEEPDEPDPEEDPVQPPG